MGWFGWRCIGVATALVCSATVFGEEGARGPSSVSVTVEACVDLDREAVERLSALEFPDSSGNQAALPQKTRVTVGCSSNRVVVSIDVSVETTLSRRVDLSTEPPETRERTLALLIGEAVNAALAYEAATSPPRQGISRRQRQRAARSLEPWLDDPRVYSEIERRFSSPLGWLELSLDFGVTARHFNVPIDPSCDVQNRTYARLNSSTYADIGTHLSFYPGAILTNEWVSNLGLDFVFLHHLFLYIYNSTQRREVLSSEYSVSTGLTYRATFGTAERGVTLRPRLGWGRYSFFLGEEGNDIVPPFTYDHLYLGLDLNIPFASQHVGLDVGGSYLAVLGVGHEAITAYNASGVTPDAHGFDFNIGLSGQIWRGLRWGLNLEIVGFYSRHYGKGRGYGSSSATLCESEECLMNLGCVDEAGFPVVGGISTTDTARDIIWRLMLTIGYRFGWNPD